MNEEIKIKNPRPLLCLPPLVYNLLAQQFWLRQKLLSTVGGQVEHTKELERRDRHIHANLRLGSCEDVLAFLQALLSALCLNQMVVLRVVHLSEQLEMFCVRFRQQFQTIHQR